MKVLRSIKAIIFFVIFSSVLQILFNKEGTVLAKWWIIEITNVGLLRAGFITLRIVLVVMGTALLTLTTTPVEIADGIESLLIMSIALRFIPTLMDETDRIISAQKARGADFESGNIFKRIKALVPILIPLLISSFRRADELGDAMDARCYSGAKGRTKYKKMRLTYRDLIGFALTGGLIAGVVLLNGVLGVAV